MNLPRMLAALADMRTEVNAANAKRYTPHYDLERAARYLRDAEDALRDYLTSDARAALAEGA